MMRTFLAGQDKTLKRSASTRDRVETKNFDSRPVERKDKRQRRGNEERVRPRCDEDLVLKSLPLKGYDTVKSGHSQRN